MKKFIYILGFFPLFFHAQDDVEGIILEIQNAKEIPLPDVNIYWLNSSIGTSTNKYGTFKIPYTPEHSKLVISYLGYQTDTLDINQPKTISHVLKVKASLDEVMITSQKRATSRSYIEAKNVIQISSDELLKAACCNLSESFETNPTIDVNFADAITGTRRIRMLGLTSPYTLINIENIPAIRGARQAHGLSFIPGTWVESIQITKGAGSVVNGFESIAGQINTEFVKPKTDDRFFLNTYSAINGRTETNVHINKDITEKWSTGLYVHGNYRGIKNDRNQDGFLDMPLANQFNVLNRWQYADPSKGFVSFINLRYMNDQKRIGETRFDTRTDSGTTNSWGGEIDTQHLGISAKLGYVFPEAPYQSIGVQLAYNDHDQKAYYGLRPYTIHHRSAYGNLLFNSIISDSRHQFKTGLTVTYDDFDETVEITNYDRTENSIGAFFEYAYDNLDNLLLTAGLRLDTHNLFGTFVTPRLHVRFTPWNKAALRGSIGRGKRSANLFVENQSLLATSRVISIQEARGEIYGLDPEIAWNYGISFLQGFNVFQKKAEVSIDFYRTDFKNQVVVDWEDPRQIQFYNLEGESFANSLQVEFNYFLFNGTEFRTAYKYYQVETTYQNGRLERPLTPSHRVFANIAYETALKEGKSDYWKFDLTYNWLGKQRYPSTASNPEAFQLSTFSPAIGTLNAQVTKVFSTTFEVYLGAENFTDQRQQNPILDPQNPFGSNFDTTFVYGPIFGSNYYLGLRYTM
ncbi:TonB-dependent receptor [Aquimarina sp. U1-2]|uniref:TonB-dependent receptor n=1 Tax=Aquimarina sp. U1-2 TaxID=2823141 RepID=UPI001AED0413|nr:TonB-dependent receptor [Aquimarina sp. U1-2]MBP2831295.1 TonB-dependent receptor [Aquimarina sp. U1-2]